MDVTDKYLDDEKVRFVGRIFAFFLKEALPANVVIDVIIGERSHWVFERANGMVISNHAVCVLFPLPTSFGEDILSNFEVVPDREHFQIELAKLVKVRLYQR